MKLGWIERIPEDESWVYKALAKIFAVAFVLCFVGYLAAALFQWETENYAVGMLLGSALGIVCGLGYVVNHPLWEDLARRNT